MDWQFDQTNIYENIRNITSSTGRYRVVEVAWPKQDRNEYKTSQTKTDQMQLLKEIERFREEIRKKSGDIYDPNMLEKLREERTNELMH